MKCQRCRGCGKIADSEDGEPWENIPAPSNIAVTLGMVKPIPCPDCGGSGKVENKSGEHLTSSDNVG